jgi:hypothetical protein
MAMTTATEHMALYDVVKATDVPNYKQARIPLPHKLNIKEWRAYLSNYHDSELCDLLEYGWPMDYTPSQPLVSADTNHQTANVYPQHVAAFLDKEGRHGALMGPFPTLPFMEGYQISPLRRKIL